MPLLKIPSPLRSYTGGQIEVQVAGGNVGEAIQSLVQLYPPLQPHLFDADGKLRPFVNVFLGGQNVRDLDGLATTLDADTRILLVPSIAGG